MRLFKPIFLLVVGLLAFNVSAQNIYNNYDQYYTEEVEELKKNYPPEVVEEHKKHLYREWLDIVGSEKKELLKHAGDPIADKQLAKIEAHEQSITNAMNGTKPAEEKVLVAEKVKEEPAEEMLTEPQPVAENKVKEEVKPKEEPKVEEEIIEEPIVEESEAEEEFKTVPPNPSFSPVNFGEFRNIPINGVYFRIQISASNRERTIKNVQSRLGVNEEIIVEQIDGMYKYLVGKFANYNSAKAKSDELRSERGIQSFVVGYISEQRSTMDAIFKH